jgi:alkylation response protein AidB-like acyl-CoA dehydrogenase
MRFHFNEDQLLFQTTLRDFLANECTPEQIRASWQSETGHSPELWAKLAELGVTGLLVPEDHEGMGMDEIDFVLLQEEAGRAALAEPLVSTAAVAAPLLVELGSKELCERWLKRIAVGEAIVALGHALSPFVSDAHVAHLLLLARGDEVHAVDPEQVELTPQPANDPSRRLFSVSWTPSEATRVAEGERGRALWAAAFDRGALACAAQQIGVADQLVTMAVAYAEQRHQFGKPIGSFQAIKHMLANVKVKLEYARPVVHRAAHSVARAVSQRAVHVSMANLVASEAAGLAAKTALQVHGAIGYTWEQDLHIWMRRAWSLELAWGGAAFHRGRVADAILADGARLGAGATFAADQGDG